MAPPTKVFTSKYTGTAAGISTRSKQVNPLPKPVSNILKDSRLKRKADCSPLKEITTKTTKRPILGDVTNRKVNTAVQNNKKNTDNLKQTLEKKNAIPTKKVTSSSVCNVKPVAVKNKEVVCKDTNAVITSKIVTRGAIQPRPPIKYKEQAQVVPSETKPRRKSEESEKSEDSLYVSAIEEIGDSAKQTELKKAESEIDVSKKSDERKVPEGVDDFDKENWSDIYQAPEYAMDIFEYLKEREADFQIKDYIDRQLALNTWMRSLLVDWMVEVQESFELNHETLYLAVKLVDMYLSKVIIPKETLQLVGAASLFLASKYDERTPPMLDDFLYICDGAYQEQELLRMEIELFKTVDFQLGMPISYRFLRRYARCAKVTMPILTLARFILEYSLMDYSIITKSDSKLASASLYLALRMKDIGGWSKTLEYYSGYVLEEIMPEVKILNSILHKTPKEALSTVRNKYSHKIFFEVAKTPLINI